MKKQLILFICAVLLFSGCAIKVPTSSALSSVQETVGLNTIVVPSAAASFEELESALPEIAAQSTSKGPVAPSAASETALPAYTRNAEFDWALILVNKTNVLPNTYKPEIVEYNSTRKIEARVLSYLQAMIKDAKLDNIDLNLISSYRSPERQVELFNAKVEEFIDAGETRESAEVQAAKMVAPPGTSEHCTGLAVDIVSTDWYENNKSLTSKFDETDEFKWLIANCAKYGFILRYPEGKEDITMIDYEPWHYRFVGPDNARYIMENGLALEEFLALFK